MTGVAVIGVGNPYRRDDAAGLEVARRVARSAPARVTVVEHDGEPTRLIELWEGARLAVVVDTVSSGAPAGTVHRLEVGDREVPARPAHDSTHHLGIGDAVALARALERLPPRLILVGIEGGDVTAGVGLTREVAAAVERVAAAILREIAGSSPRGRTRCA